MSSWYSNLITKTSSQISSFRANISSSENDGDTEDDTHVCRVLRSYYTEKGRPFPGWLPLDPKAPSQAAPIQPLLAHGSSQQQQGSRPLPGGGGGGQPGLSSLWDNGAAQQQQAPAPPASLRVGRQPPGGGAGGGGGLHRGGAGRPGGADARAGSYSGQGPPPPAGGASAQDRLRQRLWGNGGSRTVSPGSTGQAFSPPGQGNNPYRR
ncbi:unnamed protein product [Clonostachys chloroleuca]|uniref:Mso1 N-terminal domain-containing protein n=1 Tax=Clonostachys chloroleuca TaxID=1926264 RepID=A0AA35MGD8_9HYPO|nr:unnamed protein product [Clonostachys chloroleuca]